MQGIVWSASGTFSIVGVQIHDHLFATQESRHSSIDIAIWLSHTTLGYTVALSAIDWGVEDQLFNTSEQDALLSSAGSSHASFFALTKNASYLVS